MKKTCTILVNEAITLTPKDRRTNRCFYFDINEEFCRLIIECRYSPKKLEDTGLSRKLIYEALNAYYNGDKEEFETKWHEYMPIVNHVTFSLDYENEYIGCAHRHDPEQTIIISEGFSSPGFIKRKVEPGRWRAVINIHEILTESVQYHLKMTAEKEVE